MKLYEALALRKGLQSDIAQLISLRSSTFTYASDESPEFNFDDLTNKLKAKVNEVTDLKVAIMQANMTTRLPNGLSLAQNIIELANVRSAIVQLRSLMQVDRSELGYYRRSAGELKTVKQRDASVLLDMIQEQETRRRLLDSLIQEANHTVEIDFKVPAGKSA